MDHMDHMDPPDHHILTDFVLELKLWDTLLECIQLSDHDKPRPQTPEG